MSTAAQTVTSNQTATTLAEIEALIKKRKTQPRDVSQFPIVEHKASGVRFRVCPMSGANYDNYRDALAFDQKKNEERAQHGFPPVPGKAQEVLFRYAVLTESGESLTKEVVEYFVGADNFGPSNAIVVDAATKQNPPREILIAEIEYCYGFDQSLVVLFRILQKAGALELLRDRLSQTDDEAKQKAIAELDKWIESIDVWEAVMNVEDQAQRMGISIYESAELAGQNAAEKIEAFGTELP